jgi:hypothetical protein
MAQQHYIFLEILVQPFHTHVPVEMNQPVTKTYHAHHCLAKIFVKVTRLNQKPKYIPAFLWVPQLIHGDNVRRNVCATLNRSLKGSLNGQLAGEIIPEGLERNRLLLP